VPAAAVHDFSDEDLLHAMLALQLACGKSHSALTKKRRQWFCFLLKALKVEADLRGLAAPPPQSHAGDLPAAPPSL